MRWMVFKGALDGEIRICKGAKRKVFLILDNLPVHHAKVLRPWLEKHKERIELFFMPGYSPELNPVEVANADLKKNVTSAPPPRTEEQLVENILAHYQACPRSKHIKSYFGHPDVRYAA
ncbi:MAG: transposase [Flavobacteriales bacterium]|nr:transposase [Flavobacteriales bacterium]